MDVIVVGCGASGIAAMRRLRDAGLKVIGLEASHRVGGRIYTRLFGDGVVDVGAAWCHGEKDNIVFEIANPRDLLGRPEPDNKWFIQSNGDFMPNDHCEKILKALNQAVKKADKKGTTSISECVREAVRTNPTLSKECRLSSALADWYERNSHVGGQTNPKLGKSLRGLAEFHNCKGEFMLNWKGKGYKTILDVLMEQEPGKEPLDIRTSKVVHNIKYNSDVGGSPINPFVHVKCNDNSLYAAKSVIVTVSVGVLKEQHTTLFDPPLPPEKVAAINSLELAVLDKIYIEFDAPWWPQTPANFTLLWRDEDKAKFSKEDKWITEIYGLQTVDYRPNVLLAWIYGEGAKQMEAASEATVRLGVEKILEIFNKKFKVTPIKNLIRSKWASNPFVRGAYAYRSVATEEQEVGGAISLSQPVYHSTFPLLCFAGEATSHHHHSAVHGAIEAGFREADRLIEELKKFQEYD